MDEAFGSEAVRLVNPCLERRRKCTALGDVKYVVRGAPLASRCWRLLRCRHFRLGPELHQALLLNLLRRLWLGDIRMAGGFGALGADGFARLRRQAMDFIRAEHAALF